MWFPMLSKPKLQNGFQISKGLFKGLYKDLTVNIDIVNKVG